MSKKLLKIKIQTKPVLKEGPSDVGTLLLEFKRLTAELLELSPKARKAKEAFIAFSKSAAAAKTAAGTIKRTDEIGRVITDLAKQGKNLEKVLGDAEFIFKKSLNNSAEANKLKNADEVLGGLEDISESFRAIINNKKLYSAATRRKAGDLLVLTTDKITVLKALKESSPTYIALAAKRAKQAASSIEDLPSKLPNPQKVKDLGEEGAKKAMKEVIEETGEEGAKAAAREGSKWRKWLIGAGLLATATAMYKVGTKKADADDKKPIPTPTPTPGGGGVTIGSYDLFNQLAAQVTGQKDVKEAVKMIQVMLVNLGYSVKKGETDSGFSPKKMLSVQLGAAAFKAPGVDGKVGEGTQGAVIRFQKANGLKPDGLVGPNTYAKLVSITKGGDKKKDVIQEPSKAEKVQAIRSIDALMRQLLDGNGWQRIINSYIEVQNILVTKLMNMMDASRVSDAFKQDLRRQVQKALPPIPEGTPEERLEHAESTMHSIPVKITAKTLNSIDSSIVGKDIVEIILTVLERNIKEMEDGNKKLEESKKYDLDFSKWSKIF